MTTLIRLKAILTVFMLQTINDRHIIIFNVNITVTELSSFLSVIPI